MKKMFILRSFSLVLLSAMLVSCVSDEQLIEGKVNPATDSRVSFRISVPGAASPATRALSEAQDNGINTNDIWVMMFRHTSSGNLFTGNFRGRVVPTTPGSGGATLEFETTIPVGGDTYNLMILANAGSIIQANSADLVPGVSTQTQVEQALVKKSMTTSGWQTGDENGNGSELLPMWGYASNVDVGDFYPVEGSDTKVAFRKDYPVPLVRMVARVDVSLSETAETKFDLTDVFVFNYNTEGRLIPDTSEAGMDWTFDDGRMDPDDRPAYLGANQKVAIPEANGSVPAGARAAINNPIHKVLPEGSNSLTREIYLYEAKTVAPARGTREYWLSPCVVLGGYYNGDRTKKTYYRVDFAAKTEQNLWKYLDVKRNNSYTIVVEDIVGKGMNDQEEARTSLPTNINTNLVEWSSPSPIKILLTDGLYMLGLSHDRFTFMRQAQTAASELNKLDVVTDYHGGWKAEVSGSKDGIVAVAGGWLKLSVGGGAGNVVSESTPNRPPGGSGPTTIDLITTAASSERTAWIHVTAGSLHYKVEVTQLPDEPFLRIVPVGSNEGWDPESPAISYATSNPAPQSFRVEWYPTDTPLEIVHGTRDNYEFKWAGASYGWKQLEAGDAGGYTYENIVPDNMNGTNDPLAVFSKFGKNLTFVLPSSEGTKVATIYLSQGTKYGSMTYRLADIPNPASLPPTGTENGDARSFTVVSTVSAIPEGGGDPVSVPVPWYAEFWNGREYVSWEEYQQWHNEDKWVDFSPSGNGSTTGETRNITASSRAVEPFVMSDLELVGSVAEPWNLSNEGGAPEVINTANCYVISAPGYYSIPLVYGNSVQNGLATSVPYTSQTSGVSDHKLGTFKRHDGAAIEDSYIYMNSFSAGGPEGAKLVWSDKADLIGSVNISADKKKLVVYIPKESIDSGNAVVAVTNGAGEVMWSWHLWVTPLDTNQTDAMGEYDFMKYNLGWINKDDVEAIPRRVLQVRITQQGSAGRSKTFSIVSNGRSGASFEGKSLFYQWGRKDPMPWSDDAVDIKQGSFRALSSDNGMVAIEEAIKHPEIFYGINNADRPFDWSNRSYTNLWNVNQDGATKTTVNSGINPVTGAPIAPSDRVTMAVSLDVGKTVYDPSPVGFKVPPHGAYPKQMIVGSYQPGRGVYMSAGGSVSALYQVAGYRSHTNGSVTLDQDDYDRLMSNPNAPFARHGGIYWTATSSVGTEAGNQYIDSWAFSIRMDRINETDNGVSNQNSLKRANGFSIRPVRE